MPGRLLPTATPWSQPARSGPSSTPLLAQAPPGTYYSYPHLSRAPDLNSLLHTPRASNANNAAVAVDLARAYAPLGGAPAVLPKYPRYGLSAGSGGEQSSLGALFSNKSSSSNVQVNLPGEGSTSTIDGMPHSAVQFQDSSAAQMMQKLASKPAPRHQPAPLTDRMHVSCLNVGGELFVGDAGPFGVLCSCHQLRMSVAKFCEHAGGPAEKAGEIVLMENGMSIAHWFKYCVGVGSYVTDTKCDQPEWACIDPSPEGYRLKNLLARNTSMEKVGLFNGYGKGTGPMNGTVYSNDVRKSTGPISGTVYSNDLHNEGRGHTTVEKLGNKRDETYYRSADVHTSFARNFALLQNSETNLGLAKNHTVNTANLNQISRLSGSPYITASTSAHHNGNHSSHNYADLLENNSGASFRNPAPISPVVFSNDTRAGRYNFPSKILQDSLSSASNTELKLGQSSYHQSLTALFPSAQSTLIDFQRPQSHLPSATQNHCPRQTVKVSKNIGEHNGPPVGRGTSEQSNGVANAINRSEGGKVTDAAAKNSFISIFLSHLERNSEAIDDILKSSEHSLPRGLDGAYSSYHSKIASRQVEPRANDNPSKLASTSIHTERISDDRALSVALSGSSKVVPLANSQNSLIHSDCRSHLLPRQPNAGSSKVCDGAYSSYHSKSANRQVEPRANDNHSNSVSTSIHTKRISDGIALSVAPSGYPSKVVPLANSHEPLIHSDCQSHLLHRQPNAGSSKICAGLPCPAIPCPANCRTGNHAGDVSHQAPCMYDKMGCMSFAPAPLSYQGHRYVLEVISCSLLAMCALLMGFITEDCGYAKHCDDRIDQSGSGLQKCKHDVQLPTRCVGESEKLRCQCSSSAQTPLLKAVSNKMANQLFAPISERLKNVSEESVANASSPYIAVTEKNGSCRGSGVCKERLNPGFSSGSSSAVVTKFPASPEFNNTSSCVDKYGIEHKKLMFDEGSRTEKSLSSSYDVPVSTGCEKSLNSSSTFHLDSSKVKRKYYQISDGITLKDNGKQQCSETRRKSRRLKCSEEHSVSDDCTRKITLQSSENGDPQPQNEASSYSCSVSKIKRKHTTMQRNKPVKRPHIHQEILKGGEQSDGEGIMVGELNSSEEKKQVEDMSTLVRTKHQQEGSRMFARKPPKYVSLNCILKEPKSENICSEVPLLDSSLIATGITDDNRKFRKIAPLSLVLKKAKRCNAVKTPCNTENIHSCEEKSAVRPVDLGEGQPIGPTDAETSQLSVQTSRKGFRNQRSSVSVNRIKRCEESANRSARGPCDDKQNVVQACEAHQACYGVLKVPRGQWFCRPCKTMANAQDTVCVLCGYGGGAMTRALNAQKILTSLRKGLRVTSQADKHVKHDPSYVSRSTSLENISRVDKQRLVDTAHEENTLSSSWTVNHSSSLLVPQMLRWVHVVCGLWTPGTKCPNPTTMSAFDLSGALPAKSDYACSMCDRAGGSFMMCRDVNCSVTFHAWCAHQRGLLQSDPEGEHNEYIGFYGRCLNHATNRKECLRSNEWTCARTEGFKGRKGEGCSGSNYKKPQVKSSECSVSQEQINAWLRINGSKPCIRRQSKGWKHLVVYKSGIHGLGLYTSEFIPRGSMVIEYVGEIVGQRVADKREIEYHSGKRQQYKSVCYFFKIDKEHIIDATRKGGIARFINHSCMPNCVAKIISVKNEKKVVFFSERHIDPGEEITYDYHFNQEEGERIPCFCRSFSCRRMGRKAGLYINSKKFGGVVKPCMLEMTAFLNCLALNKQIDEKCTRQKELLITCTQAQKGRPKNAAKTINYHLQRLGRDKFH
ncbi:unnamed protein product [Triticum turgidum subsp. durum]|uniref:Histone-lysine N-methyltransferase n=1 Tax=Triticum turgidum subsp. durum TaxID=4567 RepID=A0A9R0XFP5_TRITD|nr:unnamed protein product [Triticum turgidum subsp. durum]